MEDQGIQNEGPEVTDGDGGENKASGVNYHDRIRMEPDFAVEEVQKKDRYIGELHEKQNKFKPLEQYVEAVGSDELARLASLGSKIESDPALRQALENAMNGVNPNATNDDDQEDEIYDPEIKALKSRYDSTIEEQNAVIRELQDRLNKTEVASMKTSLEENISNALSVFKDDDESLSAAREAIERDVKSLETAAKAGDRAAASQLEQIAGQQGSRVLRMMTIDIYDKHVEKMLEAKGSQPDGATMQSKATDGRAVTRSAPTSDVIAVPAGAKMTSQLVAEVMENVTRKLGKDPASVFG